MTALVPGVPACGHVTDRGWWHPGGQDGCPKCEVGPVEARALAAAHVPGRRRLRGLREDAEDYLVELEPLPGGVQLGGSAIFIRKADSSVWEAPAILHMAKIQAMTSVVR